MAFKAKEDGPMSSQRHKPEEIVAKLRQVDVLVAPGTPVADAIRSIGVTEVGFGMNCWTVRSSTHFERPRSSSKAGDGMTTPSARMPRSAPDHQLRRCLGPP